MKISDSQLEHILTSFRRIRPRAEFSQHSKLLIFASPRSITPEQTLNPKTTMVSWFSRAVRIGSFTAVGVAILVLSFYATKELSPLLLPGLNSEKITAEADMIDSSVYIELSRIGYFDQSTQESSLVLQAISQEQLDHLNKTIVSDEIESINQETATSSPEDTDSTDDINMLIEKLSK